MGTERVLRQELRAVDRLVLFSASVVPASAAECPGDVAVPEIAFASRRCNKTGHNQQ
jgi:hypothetical protein